MTFNFEDRADPGSLSLALGGEEISDAQALLLAETEFSPAMMQAARDLRDSGFGSLITYSRKVFLPLTQLCRDVCHYCTFAKAPRAVAAPYMPVDQVLAEVHQAKTLGCKEALFTLGEKPELRYEAARRALDELGFASTLDYVADVAGQVLERTGVLPHINAGCMNAGEIAKLRKVSASMGIMLESASGRLCKRNMPHHGSPDKEPARRLATIRLAGEAQVPFTSGILIGIGETRRERVEALLALRALHRTYGHIQEIIIQNFRAKPGTKMFAAPEPGLGDMRWTIMVARLIFGRGMSIQCPPNLNPEALGELVDAGINDWGGVSPLTPDYVNPEAPWPQVDHLQEQTARAGKQLHERLTIYPRYALAAAHWMDKNVRARVLAMIDGDGLPRTDPWITGSATRLPTFVLLRHQTAAPAMTNHLTPILERASKGERLREEEIIRLFKARGDETTQVLQAADRLRYKTNGDAVSYVVTRNINYTNICYFRCQFCAFSKGKTSESLRGAPYDLSVAEIQRRVAEAWERGATEVCMQGGIHPDYTGVTYLKILAAVKAAVPAMHVHAFSPLEVWHGAKTLGLSVRLFLNQLKDAGLGSLPGTAAEILDDEIRAIICPDKINTAEWLEVMQTAHEIGLRTTATIMFGHVERPVHWARHLLHIRDLQARTGGFTEFVPLPFVASEAPMYLKGWARSGPTLREALLMHAVARLVLHPFIPNIQASWVKMGAAGVVACLDAGVNDLGGTLMNESITRAAGATHGQEMAPERMNEVIARHQRQAWQRTTLYKLAPASRTAVSYGAAPLSASVNTPLATKSTRLKARP